MYRCLGSYAGWDTDFDKWYDTVHGPHWFFDHCVTLNFRRCRKCGHRNTEVIF